MRVNLRFDTTDESGEHYIANFRGVMEYDRGKKPDGYEYKISYLENICNDTKNKTKAELYLSKNRMRAIRTGAMESDFLYENALVHNTTYRTPYGVLPIVIETDTYDMKFEGEIHPEKDFMIETKTVYSLTIKNELPMPVVVEIRITPYKEIAAYKE